MTDKTEMPEVIHAYHDGFSIQLTDFESEDADAFKTYKYLRADTVPSKDDLAKVRDALLAAASWSMSAPQQAKDSLRIIDRMMGGEM
jgi:hypothetical protein